MKTLPKNLAIQILNSQKIEVTSFHKVKTTVGLGDVLEQMLYLKQILDTQLNSNVINSEVFNCFLKGYDPHNHNPPNRLVVDEQGNLVSSVFVDKVNQSQIPIVQKNIEIEPKNKFGSDEQLIIEYNKLVGNKNIKDITQILGKESIKYLIGELQVITLDDFKAGKPAKVLKTEGVTLDNFHLQSDTDTQPQTEDEVECIDIGEIPVLSAHQLNHYNAINKKINLGLIGVPRSDLNPNKSQSSENPLNKILNLAKTIKLDDKENDSRTIIERGDFV